MNGVRSHQFCLVLLGTLPLWLSSCSWFGLGSNANEPGPCKHVPVEVHIKADSNLNLSAEGQAAPLEVRALALSERDGLDGLDFQAVWKDMATALGDSLLLNTSVTVFPGEEKISLLKAPPDVGYIALVALFRMPDDVEWKIVADIRDPAKKCGQDNLYIPVRAYISDNRISKLEGEQP